MDGRALRGAVSLHAGDGVADAEARLKVLVQIDEHVCKIARIGVFVVIFRLHGAGDDAEQIFRGVGHAHHAMALELAEIDDGVGIVEPCGVGELVRADSVRERCLGPCEVLVELRPHFLTGVHSGHVIDVRQMRGIEKTAGAVTDDHGRTAGGKQLYKLA